jgi:TRAP-type C4-dicarboxylate transport system permease small subunit
LGWTEIVVAVAAFTAGVSISAWQILLRYTSGASIWWGQEASLLLMMVAYFIGASVVFRLRAYVVIDFFVDMLPPPVRSAAYIFAQLAVLAFWGIVVWELVWMAPDALRTYTPIMRLPKLYFYLPLLYAAVSISVTTLLVLLTLKDARAWRTGAISELESEVAIRLQRYRSP